MQQKTIFTALSQEEREAFAELVGEVGWKSLQKLIEQLVSDQEGGVIRLNVDDGVEKLVHAKLRAEGARRLSTDIANLKQLVKKK